MKMKSIRLLALVIIILNTVSNIAMAQTRETDKKISGNKVSETILLFNGKDLNNWV